MNYWVSCGKTVHSRTESTLMDPQLGILITTPLRYVVTIVHSKQICAMVDFQAIQNPEQETQRFQNLCKIKIFRKRGMATLLLFVQPEVAIGTLGSRSNKQSELGNTDTSCQPGNCLLHNLIINICHTIRKKCQMARTTCSTTNNGMYFEMLKKQTVK